MKGQLEHKFDETFVIVSSSFPVVQLCCRFYFSVLYTCCKIFSGGSVNALSPRIRQVGLVAASLMAHFSYYKNSNRLDFHVQGRKQFLWRSVVSWRQPLKCMASGRETDAQHGQVEFHVSHSTPFSAIAEFIDRTLISLL